MNDKSLDLLQQIAIDIAVIKSRMDNLEELKEKVEVNSNELTTVKSQISVVKWVGGIVGTSVLGGFIKIFTGNS